MARDPRFGFEAFRRFAHQSSLMLPLVLDDAPGGYGAPASADSPVSGAFYLVWWTERRRFDEAELATLHGVGLQVGILLRNARLVEALENRAARLEALIRLNRVITSPRPGGDPPGAHRGGGLALPGAGLPRVDLEGDGVPLAASRGRRLLRGRPSGVAARPGADRPRVRLGDGHRLDDVHQYADLQNVEWLRAQDSPRSPLCP